MDQALQTLLSWQFIIFCLAISAVTYVITIVAQYFLHLKDIKAKGFYIWTELILPILPIVLGSLGALLAKQYPYPEGIVSGSGRFAFGLVAGLLAGLVWRVIKSMLKAKVAEVLPQLNVSADVGAGPASDKKE